MASHNEKKEVILGYERKFAAQLGREIMHKPKLSTWMVLIPFIFIFYFQDLSKYKQARKEFSDNYLLSRKKALREVEAALVEKRKPDLVVIADQAEIPLNARHKYGDLLSVLAGHYEALFNEDGDSYEDLLKSVYGKKGKYLAYLDALGEAEKSLNKALKPGLEKSVEGYADLVENIENKSEKLRRQKAGEVFA